MPLWLVKASWHDDEAEQSQQWAINVPTEAEAITEVTLLLPSKPQHLNVKPLADGLAADLKPGEARRLA